MSYKISNIELRSEKVRNLLGEIPPALVRYGTVIIVAIFLMLLLIVCFIPCWKTILYINININFTININDY